MKRYFVALILTVLFMSNASAQSTVLRVVGNCGMDAKWTFDGYTLTITNINKRGELVSIMDYDVKNNIAPWTKRNLT